FARVIPRGSNFKTAIFSENRPEWIYAIYASWHQESIPVLFDYTAELDEIAYILNDSRPGIIFCSGEQGARLRTILPMLNYIPKVIMLESFENVKEPVTPISKVDPQDNDAIALIVYTSGTTGRPKGVMLSFGNLLANVNSVLYLASPSDGALVLLPLYHIFPLLWTIIVPLYAGAVCVFTPSMDPADIMSALQNNRVTAITGVPKLFYLIRKKILEEVNRTAAGRFAFKAAAMLNSLKISRLIFRRLHRQFGGNIRFLICGGAAIDPEAEKDYRTLGFELQTGYGLTETGPMISFNRPGSIRPGSAGEPLSCNEVRIIDGEVAVRGANVMKGYFNRKRDTDDVLRDGWFFTGDLGRLDDKGFLWLTGRKKEMIILSNGKNINPEEIETKLLAVSDLIREAGVCANGDQLHAVLFPDPSKFDHAAANDIKERLKWTVIDKYNRSAPSYKRITGITVAGAGLPRTALGKIKRYQLQNLVLEEEINIEINGKSLSEEFKAISGYFKNKNMTLSEMSHIEIDAGFDSLDKVLLQSFIETSFGVKLTEEVMLHNPTVGDLIRYLKKAREDGKPSVNNG
ncbi:MAG: non-ribosomal peptide synthetase, partial [Ignavibacteriales bacterium]